jgi:hypothetical protein
VTPASSRPCGCWPGGSTWHSFRSVAGVPRWGAATWTSRARGVQELDQAARPRGPWLSIAPHDSIAAMPASLLYMVLRRLLSLVAPNRRSDQVAQIEILVLRHQLEVLRRQVKRPVYRCRDRALLTAASRILPKERWGAFLVRPETLLRWHRSLVARKWTRPHRRPGRPAIDPKVCKLILVMARENPRWGSSGSARPRRASRCCFAAPASVRPPAGA